MSCSKRFRVITVDINAAYLEWLSKLNRQVRFRAFKFSFILLATQPASVLTEELPGNVGTQGGL